MPSLPLSQINKGEAADFTFSINQIVLNMRQYYGYLILLFLPLGIIYLVKNKEEKLVITSLVMMGLIILVISPIPYALKFYVLARYFVHVILAVGIYRFIKRLKNKTYKLTGLIFLTFTLLIMFINNIYYWKSPYLYRNNYTNISQYEIEAAQFLRKKYFGQNVLLISDPATQNILEALSTINSQGGSYMNLNSRQKLDTAWKNNNLNSRAQIINQINDQLILNPEKRILIVSGRYFTWQKQTKNNKSALSVNIWSPGDLSLENKAIINQIQTTSDKFLLVYQNPTLAIFEVKK